MVSVAVVYMQQSYPALQANNLVLEEPDGPDLWELIAVGVGSHDADYMHLKGIGSPVGMCTLHIARGRESGNEDD